MRRTCYQVDFVILTDHRVKIKENEKLNKYPNLARGLKILWKIKVMVIAIVIEALETISKKLEKRLGGKLVSVEELRPFKQ